MPPNQKHSRLLYALLVMVIFVGALLAAAGYWEPVFKPAIQRSKTFMGITQTGPE